MKVRAVEDIFTLKGRSSYDAVWQPGSCIGDYCPSHLTRSHCLAIHTGFEVPLKPDEWDAPVDEKDELIFVQYPAEPFSVGALVATAVLGAAAEGTAAFAITAFAVNFVVVSALSFGASYLASRIMGTPRPEKSLLDETEPTYTFSGVETRADIGSVIPLVFGKHPVGGNIISLSTAGLFTSEPVIDPRQSRLYLVLALCEGPIADFIQILVNGNPIQNYRALSEARSGALDQTPVTGNASNEDTRTNVLVDRPLVNVSSTHGGGDVIVQRTNNPIDSYYINVLHPQGLFSSGAAILPMWQEWHVSHKLASDPDVPGSWSAWQVVWVERTIRSQFVSTTKFTVPARAVYDVRVKRAKPETLDLTNIDEIRWDSLVESINDQFSHPGIATMNLVLFADAELNLGIPQVAITIRGYKTERWDGVDPDNPVYVLDSPGYDNPAWIILTILRNKRWGLGNYIDEEDIDLESFLSWADWCNELVDDGAGDLEKRCTYSGVHSGTESAWPAILRICLTARATIVVVGQTIKVKFEHDREPMQTFTMATIRRGTFKVSYLSDAELPTRYEVRYLNEDLDWTVDIAGFDDPVAVELGLPQITETIDMFGLTRESQALREAHFHANLNRLSTSVVEFETSVNAIAVEPKDLIRVQHDLPQWGIGGRLAAATSSTFTLREELVLEAGKTYDVLVVAADDATQTRRISSPAGAYPAGAPISVATAFVPVPAQRDQFTLGPVGTFERIVMVSSIVTTPDLTRRITGVVYDSRIHDDSIDRIEPVDVSTLPDPAQTPACIDPPEVFEIMEPNASGTGWQSRLDISWQLPDASEQLIGFSNVYLRCKDTTPPAGYFNSYSLVAQLPAPQSTFSITFGLVPGKLYEVVVIAASPGGSARTPYDCTGTEITITNVGILPSAPAGFSVVRVGRFLHFDWDLVPDAASYEIRRGADWDCSTIVGSVAHPTFVLSTDQWAPSSDTAGPGEERFHIRAIGFGGLYGPPSHLAIELSPWFDPSGALVILTRDEAGLAWPGARTNITITSDNRLKLTDRTLPGTYTTPAIDLSANDTLFRIGAQLWCRAELGPVLNAIGTPWNQMTQESWHGPINPADWPYSVLLDVRFATSQAGLATASWLPFQVLDVESVPPGYRFLELRLTLSTSSDDWQPVVSELYLTVEDAIEGGVGSALPPAPANFLGVRIGPQLAFTWDPVDGAMSYMVRRGEDWDCSILMGVVPHPQTSLITSEFAPSSDTAGGPGEERFHIRAIGLNGLYGPPAHLTLDVEPWNDQSGALIKAQRDEAGLAWPGTHTNTEVFEGKLRLIDGTVPGNYVTPAVDVGTQDTIFRAGAQLWCRAVAGPALNLLDFSWDSATQMSWHGPINPAEWPYSVVLEVKYAATSGALAAATWMLFNPSDVVTVPPGYEFLQMRLSLGTSDQNWKPVVSELFLTIEDVP